MFDCMNQDCPEAKRLRCEVCGKEVRCHPFTDTHLMQQCDDGFAVWKEEEYFSDETETETRTGWFCPACNDYQPPTERE